MAYDKFNILTSSAVPLPIENVDTDQIIPARFLKATKREGFGDNLFRDWRYNGDDTPKADFVLNDKTYSGKILVGGKNFGSGSSRGFNLSKEYKIDILVEKQIIIELKSVDSILPVHEAQLISYLKLADKRMGFLINFNVPLIKSGFRRFVNNY